MMRIDGYRKLLDRNAAPDPATLSETDRRRLRMLVASVVDTVVNNDTALGDGAALLWSHPQVRAELRELLNMLAGRIAHVPVHLTSHTDVPLEIHARYTRIEILAAFGVGAGAKVPAVAKWSLLGVSSGSRSSCIHAGQNVGEVLANDSLPRLRD